MGLLEVMLLFSVIFMMVLLFLILVVQVILVVLVVLVLMVHVIGVCKLRSEDIGIDEDTGNSGNTEDGYDYCFGSGRDEDSSYDAGESESSEDGESSEDVENTEENKPNYNCLSAGGAVVGEDFPFLKHRRLRPDGPWISYVQLNEAVKFKHIDPTCKTTEDAEKKSLERNSRYPQETGEYNTVFQVSPDDFTLERNTTHGMVLKSKEAVRNWKCKKISNSKYEGTEESRMHAVFLAQADCHYSPEESRKTRVSRASGGSILLLDLISQDKSRKRSLSRGRSRIKNSSVLKEFDNMTL